MDFSLYLRHSLELTLFDFRLGLAISVPAQVVWVVLSSFCGVLLRDWSAGRRWAELVYVSTGIRLHVSVDSRTRSIRPLSSLENAGMLSHVRSHVGSQFHSVLSLCLNSFLRWKRVAACVGSLAGILSSLPDIPRLYPLIMVLPD